MKTVKPDVVAWSSTNQRTFITKGFQFLRSASKSWSAFLKEGGVYPRQPTSATMHFSFQLGEPWSAIIFSYFPVFFSFQKAILTSNDWTVFFELPELKAFSINTFLKIFAKLQNKLMLLSYLEAKRFVLSAQNWRFQLKRELPFGTRKNRKIWEDDSRSCFT